MSTLASIGLTNRSQKMLKDTIHNFLTQTHQDIWNDYKYILTSHHAAKWDYVVITASNEKQAKAFEQQIESRLNDHVIPSGTKYLCIPDPDGKRVGSGGATLNVLKKIAEEEGDNFVSFDKLRILVIHSGGDSKRVPQYSACGKLFSPVPRILPDGHRVTLFDEFMILLAILPDRFTGGMFVLSGDVLLLFNPLQISLSSNGATAISTKAPVSIGCEHGVFLTDQENRVLQFLHKQSPEKLDNLGAVNRLGNVDLDTGMVWLSAKINDELWKLISVNNKISEEKFAEFVNEEARLSFYGDFLFPLGSASTLDQYLVEAAEYKINDELTSCRKQLWNILHKFSIDVKKLSPAKFIHFGTTRELRELMTDEIGEYGFLGWRTNVISNIPLNNPYTAINSYISNEASVGPGTFLEDANVAHSCTIGKNCVVSNVNIEKIGIDLPDHTVLHVLPIIGNKFCARVFGVDDNPKISSIMGVELSNIIAKYKLPIDQIFDQEDHSLWYAMLYPVCDSVVDAINNAALILQIVKGTAKQEDVNNWLKMDRISLRFDRADTGRIIEWQKVLEDQIRVQKFISQIDQEVPLAKAKKLLGKGNALIRELKRIDSIAKASSITKRMKLYKAISVLIPRDMSIDGKNAGTYEDLCFSEMSTETCKLTDEAPATNLVLIEPVKEASCELPVRVNWGGGWSDTPPYCYDFGGTVINAAITLRGARPVKAFAKIIPEFKIILDSDINPPQEFSDINQINKCRDPFDPYALHKSALIISGIVSINQPLVPQLEKLGGGIYLKTEVDVPKGSGLGTSSILAGACMYVLAQLRGRKYSISDISDQVLCVEQLMSTGGGWQDQIGGLVNGIKLIKTKPGLIQKMNVQQIEIPQEALDELSERFVLIYTGQQRLARNILREVVGRVLERDETAIQALSDIQKLAVLMSYELEKGHINEFARLLNEHWEISKKLDPGTTNTCIDYIFSCCEEMIEGKFICGAGGGGFLQVILKEGYTKKQLAERLESMFQENGVEVYDTTFA